MPPPKPPAAGRRHVEMSPTALIKSGSLAHELKGHAFERGKHFFHFVVTMKMVVFELNRLGGAGTPHTFSKWVSVKATDQIGSGLRSQHAAYAEFDTEDPKIVDAQTTRFTRVDAAHFCNLGLKPGLAEACQANEFTQDGYERLKVFAGNTMWLPQQINIGPDRIIDVLHGEMGPAMLDDGKVIFSMDRIRHYVAQVSKGIQAYATGKKADGELGLEACAKCYLEAYADTRTFEERIYRHVYPEILALCQAAPGLRGQGHQFFV